MTYREAVHAGGEILKKAKIIEAENDAWLLLSHACRMDRTFYFMHGDETMTEEQSQEYQSLLRKRVERIPLQYITGEQDFMGLTFKVDDAVLVPRQDTETLVEQALLVARPGMHILDLCTGSGCILISILKKAKGMTGLGTDISKRALSVAKENARIHEVAADFECSNLFEKIDETFDMIVSNPPYIPTDVIDGLMPEVAIYEPREALDGMEDGLYFYRKIVHEAREYLSDHGILMFEIGHDQGRAVSDFMIGAGYLDVKVIKDLANNDRVVTGHL